MISIIIPTYNESENITGLAVRIKACLSGEYELIIVDDDSPDGTGAIAEGLAGEHPVKVIHRKKSGLASAVVDGFKAASGDLLCVMDADLSHPPETIPLLLKDMEARGADIAIASRFIKGGSIDHWPKIRLLGTNLAMLAVRPLTGVRDPMSGFFILKRSVVRNADLVPRGFKILLEILVKGTYRKAVEFPFVFQDRVRGSSKIDAKVYLEFARQLPGLYCHKFNVWRFGIAIVFAAMAGVLACSISSQHTSGDFDVYYKAGKDYLSGAKVYVPHGGIEEFKYLPLFALAFSPLTMLGKTAAVHLWGLLNIALLYAMFYLLHRLKQIPLAGAKDLVFFICLFALTGRYIFSNIKLGQANILLCFLMVLTMYLEIHKRYFWAAVVLAFSLMIKFFPLLFLAYFVLKRRFEIVIYTILMAAVFLLLPGIYSGFDANWRHLQEWFVLLKSTPPGVINSAKNYSLLSFFSWLLVARHDMHYIFDYGSITRGPTLQVYFYWAAGSLVLFGLYFYDIFGAKKEEAKAVYCDYACLFVCGLLFNPLAYLNALTFLFIPYFFILRYLFYWKPPRTYAWAVGALTALSFALSVVYNKMFFKDDRQFYMVLEYRPLMWAVVLVYVGLLLVKRSLQRGPLKQYP